MKNAIISTILVAATLLLIPLTTLTAKSNHIKTTGAKVEKIKNQPQTVTFYDSFKLLFHETGEIKEISAREYIVGVVAAEMPALYEEEALKAQAVAAYTFSCYKRATGTEDHDLSTDPATCQAYLTDAQLKEKWGDSYDTYYNKILNCVKAVEGEIVSYKGGTALTVYHAISPGKTNNCSDVWEKDLPYLKSVESIGDKLNKDYVSSVTLTAADISAKLGVLGSSFSEIKKCGSGLVKSINFGEKSFTGSQIQKLLSLRSATFDVAQSGDTFTFTVYGYGHGVGMSQAGADYMAKQGATYTEIISLYYPGTKIKKLSAT